MGWEKEITIPCPDKTLAEDAWNRFLKRYDLNDNDIDCLIKYNKILGFICALFLKNKAALESGDFKDLLEIKKNIKTFFLAGSNISLIISRDMIGDLINNKKNRSLVELILSNDLYQHIKDLKNREFIEIINCPEEIISKEDSLKRDWEIFTKTYDRLRKIEHFRPSIDELDRFDLTEEQEKLVVMEPKGLFRIQGPAGSGKTIVLIHRAMKLAIENPQKKVCVFTINQSLADWIKKSCSEIYKVIPSNINFESFYDFHQEIINFFDDKKKYRSWDHISKEVSELSWDDFWIKITEGKGQITFKQKDSLDKLIRIINSFKNNKINAKFYIFDELIYIQSMFGKKNRKEYLDTDRCEREGRSIPFLKRHRETCLDVLNSWDDYRSAGDIWDHMSLASVAFEHVLSDGKMNKLEYIRNKIKSDFVLIDEYQDLSTIELRLLKDIFNSASFAFFGDYKQKVYSKQHSLKAAGLDFRGKSYVIKKPFRCTSQIYKVASRLIKNYQKDLDTLFSDREIYASDEPDFNGPEPGLVLCTVDNHLSEVFRIVKEITSDQKIACAIVSNHHGFICQLSETLRKNNILNEEIFDNNQIHLHKDRSPSDSCRLFLGTMEAVKGREFDAVIVCHLSDGYFPTLAAPMEEDFRQAAVLYCAMTRAKKQLFMTYIDRPSRLIEPLIGSGLVIEEDRELDIGRLWQSPGPTSK